MKSRYCYCPMTAKKIGRRITLFDVIRKIRYNRKHKVDVFPICGYNQPIYPSK